jgi:amidase
MSKIREYDKLDALDLATLVRRREVSAAELLEEAIARTERVNPQINAVIAKLYEEARLQAQAPLEDGRFKGVPFLLKDLQAAMAGAPVSFGSRFLAGFKADHDNTLVERYRRAGLVIFGRTNTPEFGLTPFTEPAYYGPTRNPWNLARTPGGSSGGAAAAVAAGIIPVAHASDGGGSIRIPAACCGLFGLKPTRGRTPCGPDFSELWRGLAIDHVISRSVRDSAAMLDATAGPEWCSPYHAPAQERPFLNELGVSPGRLRVAFTKKGHLSGRPIHPDCAAAVDDVARLMAGLGHQVEEADLDLDAEQFARDFFLLLTVDIAAGYEQLSRLVGHRPRRGEIETDTALMAMIGRQQRALDAALARDRQLEMARQAMRFFQRYDVLLSPTLGTPPVRIGELIPRGAEHYLRQLVATARFSGLLRLPGVVAASVSRIFDFVPFTPLANVTGQPSMNVPLHWNAEGLPVGTMFTARFGEEATLLRLAAQLEAARPWKDRRPPVHASAVTVPAAAGEERTAAGAA